MSEPIENIDTDTKVSYYKTHPSHVLNKRNYYLQNKEKILQKSREKYRNTVKSKPLSKKIIEPINEKVDELKNTINDFQKIDNILLDINRAQLIDLCTQIKNLPIAVFEFITKCLTKSYKNPDFDLNKFHIRFSKSK
jgi:CHAT domain-containing protein